MSHFSAALSRMEVRCESCAQQHSVHLWGIYSAAPKAFKCLPSYLDAMQTPPPPLSLKETEKQTKRTHPTLPTFLEWEEAVQSMLQLTSVTGL